MKYIDRNGNEITLSGALNLAEIKWACPYALDYIRENPDTWINHDEAPDWCRWYADHVIGGRWPEAEHVIMRDPMAAEWYARDVIGSQ